jgi:hypothetical protein
MIPKVFHLPLFNALLFIILAMPGTFAMVDTVLTEVNVDIVDAGGLPTRIGIIIHALVFALLTFFLMKC